MANNILWSISPTEQYSSIYIISIVPIAQVMDPQALKQKVYKLLKKHVVIFHFSMWEFQESNVKCHFEFVAGIKLQFNYIARK